MLVKVCSFWTSEPYYQAAMKLEASLHGELYEISKVEASTWAEAVCHKPRFVLEQLEGGGEISGVLWTDADSILCRKPDFSAFDGVDLAACFWQRSPHHEEEILTGTFFIAKTKTGIDLCREWAFTTPKYRHHFTPEQAALKEVLAREEFKEAKIKRLGVEWCYVFDDFKELYPEAAPIFEHYQLSRTQRNVVQPS